MLKLSYLRNWITHVTYIQDLTNVHDPMQSDTDYRSTLKFLLAKLEEKEIRL